MAEGVEIGTAWVKIAASARGITKDVEKELGEAGEAGSKAFGKGFEKGAKESGGAVELFEKNSTKLLLAATGGAAALFGLASAAGNLSASLATADRVFGDSADSIKAFAADTEDAVFLSENAALQAANAFGIFGTQAGLSQGEAAAMSKQVVQLAADLAAVQDVPVDQAILDLRSAFAGSTETMQKYGINLNETELKAAYFAETGERITGVMTGQQRTMAVYWALLEKGAFAFGAAESEADQFAARVDNLKAIVGNIAADFGGPIVGFAEDLMGAVGTGLQGLIDFNDATGGMFATGLTASLGLGAAAAGAAGLIGKVSELTKKMRGPTGALNTFGKFSLAAGAVGLALTAGFTIYGLATSHSRELAEQSQRASDGMTAAATSAWDYAAAAKAAGERVTGLAIANSTLGLAVLDAFAELDTDVLGRFNVSAEDLGETLLWLKDDPVTAMRSLGKEANLTDKEAGALATTIAVYGSTSDDLATTNNLGYYLSTVRGEFELTEEQAYALAERVGKSGLANDLEDMWDAANTAEFDEYAKSLLNAAVASGEWSKETITGIETQTGLNRETGDSAAILALYYQALQELTPEQQAAATSGDDLAGAILGAGDAASDFDSPTREMVEILSDADRAFRDTADAASAFDDMLRRLVDPTYNLTRSYDDLTEGILDVEEALAAAKEGEEGYSLSVDRGTREGLKNHGMFMDRAQAIRDVVSAEAAAGASSEELEALYRDLNQELIQQVYQYDTAGLSVGEYIAQLGNTPDLVSTTIELVDQDKAREQLESLQEQMGGFPPSIDTEIRALIAEGDYQRALNRLNQLVAGRTARIALSVVPGMGMASNALKLLGFAHGGRFEANSPTLGVIGEAPWTEHVVTTGNLPNFRRQVQEDNDLRSAVLNVASDYMEPAVVGVGGGSGGISIGELNVGTRQDLPDVDAALQQQLFRMKHGLAGVA